MNKKELRKELTVNLLKGMEDILNKHNDKASKKIRKITLDASKTVAKKFVKALKDLTPKTAISKTIKKTLAPAKTPSIPGNKIVPVVPKKKIVPLKSKAKK